MRCLKYSSKKFLVRWTLRLPFLKSWISPVYNAMWWSVCHVARRWFSDDFWSFIRNIIGGRQTLVFLNWIDYISPFFIPFTSGCILINAIVFGRAYVSNVIPVLGDGPLASGAPPRRNWKLNVCILVSMVPESLMMNFIKGDSKINTFNDIWVPCIIEKGFSRVPTVGKFS